jgi:hypothetical protein
LKAIFTYISGISTGSPAIFMGRPFLPLLFDLLVDIFPESHFPRGGKGLPQINRPREIRDSRRERGRPGDEKTRMNHPPPRTDYRLVTVFLMKSIQKF